jgi:hypothetical protein
MAAKLMAQEQELRAAASGDAAALASLKRKGLLPRDAPAVVPEQQQQQQQPSVPSLMKDERFRWGPVWCQISFTITMVRWTYPGALQSMLVSSS